MSEIKLDERISKGTHTVYAPWFYFLLCELVLILGVKLYFGESILQAIPELMTIVFSLSYYLIKLIPKKLLFIKDKDEYVLSYRAKVTAGSFQIALLTILISTASVSFGLFRQSEYHALYLMVIFLPVFIIIFQLLKKGLYIQQYHQKKRSNKVLILNAITSGIVFYGLQIYFSMRDQGIELESAIKNIEHIFYGTVFALFMLFGQKYIYSIGEKRANRIVKSAENRG